MTITRCITRLFFPLLLMLILAVPSAMAAGERYKRSVERYSIPDVVLINQKGERVTFPSLFETDQPVVLDFIYGTCTTICPVLSAGFANLQKKMDRQGTRVRLISVTIDPENDSPKVMNDYLKRYRANDGWDFFTGTRADIDKVMTAFDAYVPDKMSHYPLNFIRDPKTGTWVRLFGILSSREFMAEYKKVAGQ